MILLTLRRVSASTWRCTMPATSASTRTLRGLEIAGSSGVVAPTMPIRSPRSLSTVLDTMSPALASAASLGSPERSRLADTNGGASSPKLSMKSASTSGPKSNSWLPMVVAS